MALALVKREPMPRAHIIFVPGPKAEPGTFCSPSCSDPLFVLTVDPHFGSRPKVTNFLHAARNVTSLVRVPVTPKSNRSKICSRPWPLLPLPSPPSAEIEREWHLPPTSFRLLIGESGCHVWAWSWLSVPSTILLFTTGSSTMTTTNTSPATLT